VDVGPYHCGCDLRCVEVIVSFSFILDDADGVVLVRIPFGRFVLVAADADVEADMVIGAVVQVRTACMCLCSDDRDSADICC
jgi:hypothetical protein